MTVGMPRTFACCTEHLPDALKDLTDGMTRTIQVMARPITVIDARFWCIPGCGNPAEWYFRLLPDVQAESELHQQQSWGAIQPKTDAQVDQVINDLG